MLLVALVVAAGVVGFGLYAYTHADRIYQGVTIAGVSLGGMTEAEARGTLGNRYAAFLDEPVILDHDGRPFTVVPSEAGIALDVDGTVSDAFGVGRSGSFVGRSRVWARALFSGIDRPARLAVDDERLNGVLTAVSRDVARAPANAFVQMEGAGSPKIVPEQPGVAFDLGTTKSSLLSKLGHLRSGPVRIAAPIVAPAVSGADLTSTLTEAQAAVDSELMLSGVDRYWSIPQEDLKQIVIAEPGGPIQVNRDAVERLVRGIAEDIEHPAVDAALFVNDRNELEVTNGDASVEVRIDDSIDVVVATLTSGSNDAALVIDRAAPAISDGQANDARLEAEKLVGPGLQVEWTGGSTRLGQDDLLAALTIEANPGDEGPFELGFSTEVMSVILGEVAETIDVAPKNPTFRLVDDKVKRIEKGANGVQVDLVESSDAVIDAVLGGERTAKLSLETLKPEYGNADAKRIKLPDVLATSATYYGNSSEPRRKNVERAVELEHGWLVAPGDVFSYNEHVGPITKKNGYVTGLGILSDGAGGITTGPVVGGGVCQVSTTVFQSAFWAGLAIVERWGHPYWIQTYGQPPSGMQGLDAMINVDDDPALTLDLRFRNTTEDWIAVVVRADGENVSTEIRGTKPDWQVKVDDAVVSNIVQPDPAPVYTDSPEIPVGEERQVETAQEGFDATIRRQVLDDDGTLIDEYGYTSTYVPALNRYLRGIGSGD